MGTLSRFDSNTLYVAKINNRITSKFEPYVRSMSASDPRLLLLVYGPPRTNAIGNVQLTSSLADLSEQKAPSAFAVSQFYQEYLALKEQVGTLNTAIVGAAFSNDDASSGLAYDTVHELTGKVLVDGPLVARALYTVGSNGEAILVDGHGSKMSQDITSTSAESVPSSLAVSTFYQDFVQLKSRVRTVEASVSSNATDLYASHRLLAGRMDALCMSNEAASNALAFRFTVGGSVAVASYGHIPFAAADPGLPFTSIESGGFRAPADGVYSFDVAARLKVVQIGKNADPIRAYLVKSTAALGAPVAAFDPGSGSSGSSGGSGSSGSSGSSSGSHMVAEYSSPHISPDIGYPLEDTCTLSATVHLVHGDHIRLHASCSPTTTLVTTGNVNVFSGVC